MYKKQTNTKNNKTFFKFIVEYCLHCGIPGFDLWVGKIPWRRKWQSIPVFLPGKSHGQRSLVGYSLWGRKELDTTEQLYFDFDFRVQRLTYRDWH